jgi:hypothetical protein
MAFTRSLVLLGSSVALVGCSNVPAPVETTLSIVGTWYPLEAPPGCLPYDGPNSVTYSLDGKIVTRSGAQVLKGTYRSIRIAEGVYRVSVVYSENNGELNCQGLSPEFVIANTPPEFTVERNGAQLRTCLVNLPNVCFHSEARDASAK